MRESPTVESLESDVTALAAILIVALAIQADGTEIEMSKSLRALCQSPDVTSSVKNSLERFINAFDDVVGLKDDSHA